MSSQNEDIVLLQNRGDPESDIFEIYTRTTTTRISFGQTLAEDTPLAHVAR